MRDSFNHSEAMQTCPIQLCAQRIGETKKNIVLTELQCTSFATMGASVVAQGGRMYIGLNGGGNLASYIRRVAGNSDGGGNHATTCTSTMQNRAILQPVQRDIRPYIAGD